MEKKNNKKGFTLAELLIVVAIIAVLVAIAIPIFTNQLEKSREATDKANIRSAYAEVVTAYMEDGQTHTATVAAQQKKANWQSDGDKDKVMVGADIKMGSVSNGGIEVKARTSGNYEISISDAGVVSCKND